MNDWAKDFLNKAQLPGAQEIGATDRFFSIIQVNNGIGVRNDAAGIVTTKRAYRKARTRRYGR